MRSIVFAIVLVAIALLTGGMVAQVTPAKMLICICALVIFTAAFIKVDWG